MNSECFSSLLLASSSSFSTYLQTFGWFFVMELVHMINDHMAYGGKHSPKAVDWPFSQGCHFYKYVQNEKNYNSSVFGIWRPVSQKVFPPIVWKYYTPSVRNFFPPIVFQFASLPVVGGALSVRGKTFHLRIPMKLTEIPPHPAPS